MDDLTQTCMDKDTIESFCGCIGSAGSSESAAQAFCNRAKTDKKLNEEDLTDLKTALMDDEESCCDCEC